jgi:hypothetical protein
MDMSDEIYAPATLPLGKEIKVSTGAQSRYGGCGEDKNLSLLPESKF